ncbi:MAG: Hsp20/alpha crystallin family protein [Lentisphaeraceae bacterium]|nr:Hsp20/alpha crystallin family protein [Lentisphaeraceae bacterium]
MSTLTAIRPFEDIVDLFFNERSHKTPSAKSVIPAMNAKADDKQLVLEFELPGYEKDEINVRLDERILTVSAEKNSEAKAEENSQDKTVWIRREINSSKFERKVTIPENIDVQNINAENKNGILTLTLPKVAKEEKVINISVK